MANPAKKQYDARVKRFHDAVSLSFPDRVPIASVSAYFFYQYAGLSFKDAMYDYEKAAAGVKEAMQKLQWDMTPSVGLRPGPVMELLGLKQYKWPGYDLPDDYMFQFIEGEYMSADEYDDLLANPEGFTIRKLMPRLSRLLEPFADVPPAHWMSSGPALLTSIGTITGNPEIVDILETLQRVGAEMNKYTAVRTRFVQEMKNEGYPMMAAAHSSAPYDWITDYLRGMRGIMLDMFRCPDKLLAAIDLFTPMLFEKAIQAARETGNPRVFMPLHRGAGGFMSNEQYAKFYWPGLKKVLMALIDMLAASGGLIIDGGSGIPYESKPENVEAMTEAVFEYGCYR